MKHDRLFLRKQRIKKIKKRKNMVKSITGVEWYEHDGVYAKGIPSVKSRKFYPSLRTEKEKKLYQLSLKEFYNDTECSFSEDSVA